MPGIGTKLRHSLYYIPSDKSTWCLGQRGVWSFYSLPARGKSDADGGLERGRQER